MQRYLVSLLCLFSIFAYPQEQPKAIVFDLGDTLIVTDKLRAFNATGWMPFIQYAACAIGPKLLKLPEVIEQRYFTVLNKIEPRRADETQTRAPNGRLIPQVMCSWMKGERSNADTRALIIHTLEAHPEYCANDTERKLIIAMVNMNFTPHIFTATRKLATGAVELVQWCKEQGYKVMALSNWDPESIDLVKAKFPQLFDLIDEIIISGKRTASDTIHGTGVLKPDPRAYHALLSSQQPPLAPHQYIFIDDRPENLDAADDCGIQTIQCPWNKAPNLAYVHTALKNIQTTSPVCISS